MLHARTRKDGGSSHRLITVDRDIPIPQAFLENEDLERPIPEGRPDVVVNPIDFEEEV